MPRLSPQRLGARALEAEDPSSRSGLAICYHGVKLSETQWILAFKKSHNSNKGYYTYKIILYAISVFVAMIIF